jgi:hypothetical protein
MFELSAFFFCAWLLLGNHAHPGGLIGLVLAGAIGFGRDADRAVSNDLLSCAPRDF